MTLTYPMSEKRFESETAKNNPCHCAVCKGTELDDQVKCDKCETRYTFGDMIVFHGINGVEPHCLNCWTYLKTTTYHCGGCGGLLKSGYPKGDFTDTDFPHMEDCEGWCNYQHAD